MPLVKLEELVGVNVHTGKITLLTLQLANEHPLRNSSGLSTFCPHFRLVIEYADSPSGKAWVGVAKQPLMDAEGFGFQGVLLQDEERKLVQCHGCGKWMRQITETHLRNCLKCNAREYKEKFGINFTTGLVSDDCSLKRTKAVLANTAKHCFTDEDRKKRTKRRSYNRVEYRNSRGICPLQMKVKLYDFIKCNRELPSESNRGRDICTTLTRRFGSWSTALAAHGLPTFQRRGTTLEFTFFDGSKFQYNMMRFDDREKLFALLMQKCPVLA